MLFKERVIQRFKSYNNHFTSLVEPRDSAFQTAFYWDHRYTDMFVDIVNVKTTPMWVELLHGNNVANGFNFHYKNSCLLGYILFDGNNFGYKNITVSLGKTLKYIFKGKSILNRLRSVKHNMIGK